MSKILLVFAKSSSPKYQFYSYLPFSSDNKFLQFVSAQSDAAHTVITLCQPLVPQTLFGRQPFPVITHCPFRLTFIAQHTMAKSTLK